MNNGLIFDIKRFAVHDGPGIRTTVFFKGCPLHCIWCHNPEGISSEPQLVSRSVLLDGRSFELEEKIGLTFTVDQLFSEIDRDRVFYEESGGGVTFSGGEPLQQSEFLLRILKKCKENGIHTVLDTCGYSTQQEITRIIPFVDLFLYDLKLIDETQHIKYTGVSNRVILENLNILREKGKAVIIRFPVIPGLTDSPKNVEALAELLEAAGYCWKLHLLPFHSIAENKYKKLGLEYKFKKNETDLNSRIMELSAFFRGKGMETVVGG
jgi:pyruvate formate lyase activating enzyme